MMFPSVKIPATCQSASPPAVAAKLRDYAVNIPFQFRVVIMD
jgi:hypothetical protein